jgi:hypothetical protein
MAELTVIRKLLQIPSTSHLAAENKITLAGNCKKTNWTYGSCDHEYCNYHLKFDAIPYTQ